MKTIKQPCWVNAPTTREKGNKLKSFLENRGIDTHFYSMYMDFGGLCVLKNNEIISEYSTRERGGKSAIAAIKNTYPELEIPKEEPKEEYKFTPFEQVLVRDGDHNVWRARNFEHIDENNGYKYITTTNCGYAQCIPYKGNESLAWTTNNPK